MTQGGPCALQLVVCRMDERNVSLLDILDLAFSWFHRGRVAVSPGLVCRLYLH